MLSKEEKKKLSGLASTIDTKYQIGKNGINDNVLMLFDKALEAHELIKISVLKNCDIETSALAIECSTKLNAEVVNIIGRVIILYRKSKNKDFKHLI